MDAIAVITYPGHFYSTVKTVNQLRTMYDAPVYIFADNKHPDAWDTYLLDVAEAVGNCTVIPFAKFGFEDVHDGWLRQQLVKLNLHWFLPGELWYVSDGDVTVERELQPNEVPYNWMPTLVNSPTPAQQRTYIKHFIGVYGLTIDDKPIFTHHAPIRYISKKDLVGLHNHVLATTGNEFNDEHLKWIKNGRISGQGRTDEHMSLTEWDLLENYRLLVDKQELDLVYYDVGNGFDTFYGTDRDLQFDTVDDKIWQKIPQNRG